MGMTVRNKCRVSIRVVKASAKSVCTYNTVLVNANAKSVYVFDQLHLSPHGS